MPIVKKLKPEIKALWLAALRSGIYKQTRGKLRKNNAYCCLGVLCKVMDVPTKRQGELPPQVAEAIGLTAWDTNPVVKYDNRHTTLADLNDQDKLSFEQIADVIEKEL